MYYLDNGATTPLLPEVKKYIISLLDNYYNPSSQYREGLLAKKIIKQARDNVSKLINAKMDNIIFTSGGSASNTLAIKGFVQKNNYSVLYSPIAHKSILNCVKTLKKAHPLSVDKKGNINIKDLKEYLSQTSERFLVVIDYANSELGTIQDVKKIIGLVHFYNGIVYLDCTGSISQIPINVKKLNVDMLGFSGHKIHALKGIGVLYKKNNIILEPLIYGSQEQGLFSGTENVLGIASIGKASECLKNNYNKITPFNRDYVINYLLNHIQNSYIIGNKKKRLPYNLYICFKGCEGESLLTLLDLENIKVSTGSACNSGNLNSSTTLRAIHMNEEDINCCIRLTFSGEETIEELIYICEKIQECVEKIRKYGGYSSLNTPIEPYIELDGGYAVCRTCQRELEPWQEICECGQVQDWTWRQNKEVKDENKLESKIQ